MTAASNLLATGGVVGAAISVGNLLGFWYGALFASLTLMWIAYALHRNGRAKP